MSLPLRFKAVRKSDGLESFVNYDMREAMLGSNHCAGSIDIDGFFSFDLNSTPDLDDVEICQSTGLTDSRGVEVFEGDVLLDEHGWMFFVVWEKGLAKFRVRDFVADGYVYAANTINNMRVIGNRWMPAEELKARAEAVSATVY